MIATYIIAVLVILAVLAAWVIVQHLARAYASRHPEFGPAREEGSGCGLACRCNRSERKTCERNEEEKEQKNAKGAKDS